MPTDRERLLNEMKMGVLLRAMIRSIRESQDETISSDLFDDDDTNKSCAKWYRKINRHFRSINVIRSLNFILEICLDLDIDPVNDEEFGPMFKKLLRLHWSEQTILKMRTFTQLPQIAFQDESEYKADENNTPVVPFTRAHW
ncbi:MAG TPA: hypothetical protein VMY59_08270 [Candidatus Thermoplasmatota archaeon]|nr:hypothetical protein [Candidatus Thermoplasmatota archaeon]